MNDHLEQLRRNVNGSLCMRTCALAFALLVIALPAFAASGGSGPSTKELVWQLVNLILLLAIVFAAARKPIAAYFAERRKQIKGDIDTADQLLADSRRQFAEWQGKLAELEGEVQTIREETRRRAEDERDEIVAAAHDNAERIKADAVTAIDQELRRAHAELRDEAANLAVDLAAGILDENVDDRDRDRLLDEFITHVEPSVGSETKAPGNGRE
ncbi:MAG: F0F1 ATP synthase subunit B [bacterium]|nr:F0F1 ATP synthase subunit B [bacterium]